MGVGNTGIIEDSSTMNRAQIGQGVAESPAFLEGASQGTNLVFLSGHWHNLGGVVLVVSLGLSLLIDF